MAHRLTADERTTPGRVAGVVLGIAGVAVIIGPGALRGLGARALAQLAILGASLSYAFGAVFGRRFRDMGIRPHVTATGRVSASTVMLLPLALLVDRPWTPPMPDAGVWGAVLGLAVLSTAAAYIIYFRILGSSGATLQPRHFAGMLLIGLGLAAIDGRALAWRWSASRRV